MENLVVELVGLLLALSGLGLGIIHLITKGH